MDLRSDLSKLLQCDLKEQKLRVQEAQLNTEMDSRQEAVDGSLPIITALDSDLSDWLSDCADTYTIHKV